MWGVFIFTYQYAVIGGDMRQVLLLQDFAGKHSCIRFGIGEACENAEEATSIEQAVSKAKNLLLPIPMCKGDKLNIQQGEAITKEQLLEYVRAGQSIFAGCIDAEWKWKAFEKGVTLDDGYETMPSQLKILKSGEESEIELTIHEGKFHQVRRMFFAMKNEVTFLKRIAIGKLFLDSCVQLGNCVKLTKEDIMNLL